MRSLTNGKRCRAVRRAEHAQWRAMPPLWRRSGPSSVALLVGVEMGRIGFTVASPPSPQSLLRGPQAVARLGGELAGVQCALPAPLASMHIGCLLRVPNRPQPTLLPDPALPPATAAPQVLSVYGTNSFFRIAPALESIHWHRSGASSHILRRPAAPTLPGTPCAACR